AERERKTRLERQCDDAEQHHVADEALDVVFGAFIPDVVLAVVLDTFLGARRGLGGGRSRERALDDPAAHEVLGHRAAPLQGAPPVGAQPAGQGRRLRRLPGLSSRNGIAVLHVLLPRPAATGGRQTLVAGKWAQGSSHRADAGEAGWYYRRANRTGSVF